MRLNPKLVLCLALLFSASMWFYMDRILVPYQVREAAAHGSPRGVLSDLYPRWLGARELLLHGRDPYSPDVTREIQAGYYGRPLDPSRPEDPKDQQGFAYPVYVVFLLAPTVSLPFSTVQSGFNVVLWLATSASVFLWLRVLRWSPGKINTAVFVILMLGSIPAVQGIKLQQLSLVVAALLAAGAAAIAGGYLFTGGVLIGLAIIKPQLAWLAVLWALAWSLRDWRRRRRVALGLALTVLALLGGAQIVLPGWIGEFRTAVQNYHQYTHNISVLEWLFTPLAGDILAAVLVLVAAVLCWPLLKKDAGSAAFATCLAMVMALTVLVVPMFAAPYNQALLLPAVMLLARHAAHFCNGPLSFRVVYVVGAALVFWPWLASLGLMLAAMVAPPETVQSAWKLPFATGFVVPIFVFGLLLMYVMQTRQEAAACPTAD